MIHRTIRLRSTALVLAALGGASVVYADGITYIDQRRGVDARVEVHNFPLEEHQVDFDEAPDFGLFDSMVSVDAAVPGASAHADASQYSEILPYAISGSVSTNFIAVQESGADVRRA